MKRMLRSLIIGYVIVIIVLAFLQRKLLYPATKTESLPVVQFEPLQSIFAECSDVEIAAEDNTKIQAWLLRNPPEANKNLRPIVLYLHGNAGNRSHRVPWYDICQTAGLDVLAIDYPGYGDSEGKPTEGGIEKSCRAAVRYLKESGYSANQIFIGGTSLGGAAAVYTAEYLCQQDTPPAGLFVTSTFSSMTDVASALYWWLPVKAVLIDTFPSAERIPNVTCPLLVMHGDRDTLVAPRFGQRLFDAAPEQSACGIEKKFVSLVGAGHNDPIYLSGPLIKDSLKTFVSTCLQPGEL